MNGLTIVERNGAFVADSREVAEMISKRHSDLLRDIENYTQIIENAKLRSQNFFIEDSYKSEGNSKSYKRYWLTRKGCDMVANKMTGEKGVLFTAAYVTKFEEMEHALQAPYKLPQNYKEALLALVDQISENEKIESEKLLLEQQAAENAPKLSYLEKILQSTGTLAITQIAKDYGLTGQQLNRILHEEGIQFKVNGQWVLYSKYQNEGLTKSNTFLFEKEDGEIGSSVTTRWTQAGRVMIHHILEKRGISAELDQQKNNLFKLVYVPNT